MNTLQRAFTVMLLTQLLLACSATPQRDSGPRHEPDLSGVRDAVPRAEPPSRYGNPASYEVNGKRYYTLKSSRGFVQRGIASWYGSKFHGRRTSSGETYDMYKMTAAHKTLPLPTYAQVTNVRNGRSVIVKINDRGPFHDNRVIDLSYAAAKKLDIARAGTGLVEVRAIDPSAPGVLPPGPRVAEQAPAASFYIQVGAFAERINAERLHARLAGSIAQVGIFPGDSGGRTVYRVRVGPLLDVEAADSIVRSLVQMGIGEHVVVFN